MRLIAALWPFTFGVRLGWATTTVPYPPLHRARGRAYLLRGQSMVFSRGFGLLCDRLRTAGIWAEDLRCVGDRWVRQQLWTDHRTGNLRGPLILIGHSCGGRHATFTAQALAPLGITVDLLVCLDVAWPYGVPSNVRRAVHLFRSRQRLYPARPLFPMPGSTSRIENIDLDAADSPVPGRGVHHLNMTAQPTIQDWIVKQVLDSLE